MRSRLTRVAVRRRQSRGEDRRGTVAILTALMLVFLMVMAAFAVDLAYLNLVQHQMQAAADSSALAASDELVDAWGQAATEGDSSLVAARGIAAVTAMSNQMAGKSGTYIDGDRDLRFGTRLWDDQAGEYVESWGQPPYNLVEVTVRRTEAVGRPDDTVPLFFARVLGQQYAGLRTTAVVALLPGSGFQIDESFSGTLPILPIVCDEDTWNEHWSWSAGQSGSGNSAGYLADDVHFDEHDQQWKNQSDGVVEINIYPSPHSNLPPGNRGTVDFGASNNSTKDLKRQIEYGLNADDLADFGAEIVPPLVVEGDPGISAGIKSALAKIIGQKRILPIFSSVSGNGNNAEYTIVKFVSVRIVSVKLQGSNKYLWVERSSFSHPAVIRSTVGTSEQPTLLSSGVLLR